MKDVRAVLRMALPLTLQFLAKGEIAIEILREAYAEGVFFDFICGDEVDGSCTRLREYLVEGRAVVRVGVDPGR